MPPLGTGMDHALAAGHLRVEVVGTLAREVSPLLNLDPPGFFGAVRLIMCELDYVAALYYGFNGADRRKVATPGKTINFIGEMLRRASGDASYRRFAKHLYEMYRVGLVHLRTPKIRLQRKQHDADADLDLDDAPQEGRRFERSRCP